MDITALIKAEVGAYSENRGKWVGKIGGAEITLYSRPISPADHNFLRQKGFSDFLMTLPMGAMVELIIRKAEDESGQKVFNRGSHLVPMLEMNHSLIGSMFGELFRDGVAEVIDEDADAFESRVGK